MSIQLVTGGAGFIGSNIARELLQRGRSVRIIDNFSTGYRSNLADIRNDVEVIEGDIRNYNTVRDALKNVEVVYHQGALPSVPRSIADPLTSNEVNVTGTLNILQAAKENGVRRLTFASSSSIYGNAPESVKSEDLHARPLSPYAVSKLAGEKYFQVFHQIYGLETVAIRYFNVFGPWQDPHSPYSAVIPLFIRAYAEGRSPLINGNGDQSRDFTYIANVVHGNLLAAEAADAPGNVFNVACNGSVTVNHLAEEIARLTGRTDIQPVHGPDRSGDVKHSMASIEKARKVLGYEPVVSFEEGLGRTVEFYMEHGFGK
jgi:nucleoside-diphosphate-sugar epimerase